MSVARYRRLLEVTRAYPALHSWLIDGLAAIEDGDDLAQALELRGTRAIRERNRLLLEAAQLAMPGGRSWRQAAAVAAAIPVALATRDRSKLSRKLRDAALYKALPESQRGIYDILITEKTASEFQYTVESAR